MLTSPDPGQSEFSRQASTWGTPYDPATSIAGMLADRSGPVPHVNNFLDQMVYGMAKVPVMIGHAAQGGTVTGNEITDAALNIAGAGGFGSAGLGAKAVGGAGGKVLGMGLMNESPKAFILKADGVPGRAKELAELLQSQMPDAKISISHNKSGVGESSYVTATYMPPHRKTGYYMTGEFRVSDHGVGPRRLGDYQDHIYVGDPYDASKSINRMIESYTRYKQETGTP